MIFGQPQHSRLKVLTKNNLLGLNIINNVRVEVETESSVENINGEDTILLFWTAWIYLDNYKTHSFVCAYQTNCTVKNRNENEGDLDIISSIVSNSYDTFYDKISNFAGTEPLIGIKIQTLAIRILEALILTA